MSFDSPLNLVSMRTPIRKPVTDKAANPSQLKPAEGTHSIKDGRENTVQLERIRDMASNSTRLKGTAQLQQVVQQASRKRTSGQITGLRPGIPVQCVGGAKFGLMQTGDGKHDESHAEGITVLKEIYKAHKAEIHKKKEDAKKAFKGKEDKKDAQEAFSDELGKAEMSPDSLRAKIAQHENKNISHDDENGILYKGKRIAQMLEGEEAYEKDKEEDKKGGTAAIYKKHTLDGLSEKEYVKMHGSMLRRFAYRGINPTEAASFKKGKPLRPENYGKAKKEHMGYHFNKKGKRTIRKRRGKKGKIKESDLAYLNRVAKASTAPDAMPDDPTSLSFLQARKGVGKAFSATSTPKPITSNHGEGFSGFGQITIDLARVPEANVLHHYKNAPFKGSDLAGRFKAGSGHRLDDEAKRANSSVRRNRELVLSEIPHAAVSKLEEPVKK